MNFSSRQAAGERAFSRAPLNMLDNANIAICMWIRKLDYVTLLANNSVEAH